jgi:hypothetical protein
MMVLYALKALALLAVNVYAGLGLIRLAERGDDGDCRRITHAGCLVLVLLVANALGASL